MVNVFKKTQIDPWAAGVDFLVDNSAARERYFETLLTEALFNVFQKLKSGPPTFIYVWYPDIDFQLKCEITLGNDFHQRFFWVLLLFCSDLRWER